MELQALLPPDVAFWLTRYGLFTAVCFFLALFLAVLLRPFFLWLTGRTEANERLKKLVELQQKALLELEILNQTLSIPIKKAQKKASAPPVEREEPMVLTQDTKEEFLRALERSRKPKEDDSP